MYFARRPTRQHLAGVLHQILEQRELGAGQLYWAAVDPRLARAGVKLQRPSLDHLRLVLPRRPSARSRAASSPSENGFTR